MGWPSKSLMDFYNLPKVNPHNVLFILFLILFFSCHFSKKGEKKNVDFSKLCAVLTFQSISTSSQALDKQYSCTAIKSMPQKGIIIKEIECGRIFTATFVRFFMFFSHLTCKHDYYLVFFGFGGQLLKNNGEYKNRSNIWQNPPPPNF